jgi:uncharacterized protein YqeY
MALMDKLQADQLVARKSRAAVATALLTALIGEAAMVGKNAGNRSSTDDEVLATIRKFLKNAEETRARLGEAGKDTATINEEIQILSGYLPQQMTDDQLSAAIAAIIQDTGASNMGAVMKALKERHAGLYDGRRANELIKQQLG